MSDTEDRPLDELCGELCMGLASLAANHSYHEVHYDLANEIRHRVASLESQLGEASRDIEGYKAADEIMATALHTREMELQELRPRLSTAESQLQEARRALEYAEQEREANYECAAHWVAACKSVEARLSTVERERNEADQARREAQDAGQGVVDRYEARLATVERERDAWREYAEHAEGCRECGETSYTSCYEGGRLRALAAREVPNG